MVENTGIAITDNPAYQISAAEYLQHFDHISEPGDPAKPWLLGFPVNVVDRVPQISSLFFNFFNAPSFTDAERANNTLKMAFDGEFFYVVRGRPVSFDGEQPVYKISNLNSDISILQTSLFNNTAPVRRLQAFADQGILYVDGVGPSTVNREFVQWQVDLTTGSRLAITNASAENRSLSRILLDSNGIIKLINVSIGPQ